jgi:tRNA A37 N6-isopentenylltransferase MiaA
MTGWQADIERLRGLRDQMLSELMKYQPNFRVPVYNFDGTRIKSAEELVAATGMPLSEATERVGRYPYEREVKDVHSTSAEEALPVGVGTAVERAAKLVRRKKRKTRTT